MIYVSSDWHGYPLKKLQALLDSAGFGAEDFLYVLGDVIDRNGDGGVEALRWLIDQPNTQMLLGNHEDMLLKCRFLFEKITKENRARLEDPLNMDNLSCWLSNGGQVTIDSLRELEHRDHSLLMELLDFLEELPLYERVSVNGQEFLLVHGGLNGFDAKKPLERYDRDDFLWHRPLKEEDYFPNILTVLGHTPTVYYGSPDRMFRTPTWVNIDTGGAMGRPPMLLRLDDMKEFYAEAKPRE